MNVLITGAASGIGSAVAQYFRKRGHTVYGIDLQPIKTQVGMHGFAADITDESALLAIRQQLQEQGVKLDAILNIAGIHKMASLVESDYAQMKKVIDINLSGTVLVNRVFQSCLRENGRILVVTSEVAAFAPMPFNGLYNVTKTALDAYAQALRQELNLIGQTVVTIRPGAVETPLSGGSVQATAALAEMTQLYRKQARNFSALAARFMGRPMPPEVLATLIYRASTVRHPRLVYQKHRNPGLVLLSLLPRRWQCGVIKFLVNLG